MRNDEHPSRGRAAPLNRRATLGLLAGAVTASCAGLKVTPFLDEAAATPFETDEGGRLYVLIDTPPHGLARFLIDTGAGRSALFAGSRLAGILPRSGDTRRVWGLGGDAPAPVALLPDQYWGPHRLPARPAVVLSPLQTDKPTDGLIGMDILTDRVLTIGEADKVLTLGMPGKPARLGTNWHRIPLSAASTAAGGRSLLFARAVFGIRSFYTLIDLGSDSTYCPWEVSNKASNLRLLRQRLYRQSDFEGAVARFKPRITVRTERFDIGPHRWNNTIVQVLDFGSKDLIGRADEPVIIAGMNLFRARDFVFDAVEGFLYLRVSDSASTRPRGVGVV